MIPQTFRSLKQLQPRVPAPRMQARAVYCVYESPHIKTQAMLLGSTLSSPIHYELHSTPRKFHAGYLPISFIKPSSSSVSVSQSISIYKTNQCLAGIAPAQNAIDSGVSGDIIILAKNVEITDVQNTTSQQTETKSRQSGLTVSLGGALVGAAEVAINTAKAITETKDSRAQALGAASAGLYIYNNAKAIGDAAGAGQLISSGPASSSNAANGPPEPGKQGVFDLNVSIGSSRSQSNSSSTSSTSQGSTLAAGGNITIAATGGGKDSNLLIQGSQIRADNNISLSADNAITLKAGENTSSSTTTNKNSGASIGVSIGAGGISANLSANRGKGSSDGQDISFTNTEVTAGNNLTITSGGSTALIGANVAGKAVNVDVGKTFGGDLTITSLQDKSTFTEKSSTSGFSLSVPITGGSFGASVNAGKTNINSNFESVGKQSGIAAGDGGFNVNVTGNTTLTGAVITSTDKAANANTVRPEALEGLPGTGLNSFQTGTKNADGTMQAGTGNLTITDINNSASYSANASNFSAGFSVGKDAKTGDSKTTPSGSAGIGSASGNASSVTISGITGIAGNTTVITGKDTTNSLTPIFNSADVKADVNAQVTITQGFLTQAPTAWANLGVSQSDQLTAQANAPGVSVEERDRLLLEAQRWQEGGVYRTAGHILIGGISGGASGALGAGATAVAAPIITDMQVAIMGNMLANGATIEQAELVGQLLGQGLSLLIGGATGGTAGAATGFSIDTNNRQLHERERMLIRSNAQAFITMMRSRGYNLSEQDAITILSEQADNRIDRTQAQMLDSRVDPAIVAGAQSFLNRIGATAGTFNDGRGHDVRYFTNVTSSGERLTDDFNHPSINALPHTPAADYITIQGGGIGRAGSVTVNLHTGEVFMGGGVAGGNPANFATTGASVVFGRMIDQPPVGTARGAAVAEMIGGMSVQGTVCAVACLGINQSLSEGGGLGATAIEIGIGTSGVSVGGGVSLTTNRTIPIGGNTQPAGRTGSKR